MNCNDMQVAKFMKGIFLTKSHSYSVIHSHQVQSFPRHLYIKIVKMAAFSLPLEA